MNRDSKYRREVERNLSRLSKTNRKHVEKIVTRLRATGREPTTVANYVRNLLHADRLLDGVDIYEATADDWMRVLAEYRNDRAAATVNLLIGIVGATLRDHHDGELPRNIDRILTWEPQELGSNATILSESDLHALLTAARQPTKSPTWYPREDLDVAMIWLLWDSGFRASELLSLDLADIRIEDDTGAWLVLDDSKPGLKTGARTVYVSECVGALRSWMDLHPAAPDGSAPLFPTSRDRSGMTRLSYQTFHKRLRRLVKLSGVEEGLPASQSISAHDFRHTRATRAARAKWNEAQLRAYFGWSPGSKMASHYVHLALSDLRDQVRQDAGVDDLGYHQAVEIGDEGQALVALLRRLLARDETLPRIRRTR